MENQTKKRTSKLKKFIMFIHTTIGPIFRIICRLLYGERGSSVTPIKNEILLESATSLASKIRSQKVFIQKLKILFIINN